MPAALDVDRDHVKMLVVQYGVREAARMVNLSENTVLAWSNRFGWVQALRDVPKLPPTMRQTAIGAINPVDSLISTLVAGVKETRANHVDVALRASRKLRSLPDDTLILPEQAQTTLAIAKHAALTAGWNADSRPDSPGKAFGARASGLEIDAAAIQIDDNPAQESAETGQISMDVNDY